MTRAQRTLVGVALATLVVDAVTKAWAVTSLDQPIEIGGSLSLQLGYNPGVAFGVGQSLPPGMLLAITGAICLAIAWAGWTGRLLPPTAVGLIVGGSIGILADRLTGGSVVDMIHLTWWPTFNLADVAICIGAGLIVIGSLRAPGPRTDGSNAPETSTSTRR